MNKTEILIRKNKIKKMLSDVEKILLFEEKNDQDEMKRDVAKFREWKIKFDKIMKKVENLIEKESEEYNVREHIIDLFNLGELNLDLSDLITEADVKLTFVILWDTEQLRKAILDYSVKEFYENEKRKKFNQKFFRINQIFSKFEQIDHEFHSFFLDKIDFERSKL